MIELSVHAQRRERLMNAIGPNAVALFHSPPETLRNGDVHNPFRQSSDLIYLTGFVEPGTALLLRPGADQDKVILFVRPRDKERETWDGRRTGVEGAVSAFGVDASYPITELDDKLSDLIGDWDELYYSIGDYPAFDERVGRVIAELRRAERRGRRPPKRIVDPREVLHEMRLRKSPEEIAILRRAAEISIEAHRAAMREAAPEKQEYELEALINYTFRRHGGVGAGYPSIVGGGENATILHYIENNCPLRDGDLLLIDAGCEYEYYTADVTRTFPVNGTFSDAQRRVYDIVLEAQLAGIEATKPGTTLDAIHDLCVRILTRGMIDVGLLSGSAEALIDDGSYKRFYMHRTSHWLGMDVHDAGAYTRDGKPRTLEAGMVITIEPGLYIPAGAEDVPAELRGIGVRIEDDILVTESGCENLTAAAPKTVEDVEAACRKG